MYVGETRLPFSQEPLLLYGGGLTLQTSSGSVQAILLDTHSFMSTENTTSLEQVHIAALTSRFVYCNASIVISVTSSVSRHLQNTPGARFSKHPKMIYISEFTI